ncbi:hypothetical protein N7490_008163 [Penicillium lividum]|nr:hypothetical protein N7490_008163 [Penicillium lividum]
MSFLTCASDLSPLFRLLDNYENVEKHEIKARPTPRRSFSPAFDVRELTDGYYLDGELPGVSQENIEIEFSDPTTLIIKGHAERNYNTETSEPIQSSPRRHQPTVEDEDDSDSDSTSSTRSVTSKSIAVPAQSKPADFHYWASERSIGDFQRTFSFPTRVDQDAVRASLKNGILSVVVPKATAPKIKKIRIQ